ncbi:MAG TPA: glycosyltransferase [Brumimicrobium sp.]|nr:glycosyltransferase [Brumimicrobium sp.]
MKIAFLSTFYPYRGGIAQFNGALFRALEKEHEVKAFNFSLQYPKMLFPGKTQYVAPEDHADKIPTERTLNAVNPFSYHQTFKAIKEYAPDVLIIGYWMPFMGPSLGYVAGKMQEYTRVISIVHNAIPHEQSFLDKRLSNYFFKRNTECIALSNAVKNDIQRSYPSVQTKVLLHPVYEHFGEAVSRIEASEKFELSADKKYLLFFGLIRDYKGLDNLLQALPALDENVHLIVAGEVYGSFEKYQKIIDENNIQDRVHLFLNYIPDEMVSFYFAMASAVILPYKSGTQSGIIAIAQHFNTPVVATDVGGLSEFIQNESDGLIVQADNQAALIGGIQKVLAATPNKDINQEKAYSWEDFAKEILD